MTEFWEESFKERQAMWGFDPADSTLTTLELFRQQKLTKILIPGFGYGRNARVFVENGFQVSGIEISETAIAIARKNLGDAVTVYHGSVGNMPFSDDRYEGIFCYALIHLLNANERRKLIGDCYRQLQPNGYMVFVAISDKSPGFGEGKQISRNRYETRHGVKLFYYNEDAVATEFGRYGLQEAVEISEPAKPGNKPSQLFWQIVCRK